MSLRTEYEKAYNEISGGLWIVLARSFRSMQAMVEKSIESLDIGLSDFMILEALLHTGPLSMSQLCKRVLLANTSMTSAADRLEKKKLIERVDFPGGDRRARMVALTREGEEFFRPLFDHHIKDIDLVMSHVPATSREEVRRILKSIGRAADERTTQMGAKAKEPKQPRQRSKKPGESKAM